MKKKEELEFDNSVQEEVGPVQSFEPQITEKVTEKKEKRREENEDDSQVVSCLRDEIITVRHLNKKNGLVTQEKHVLSGGMAPKAIRVFSVPKLSNGNYVNVLTNSEKDFLEQVMGLEYNALSIYKSVNNFWDDSADEGRAIVQLGKYDTHLDLKNPLDYIKYKILLANRDFIAPSIAEYNRMPKATYEYVLVSNKDEEHNIAIDLNTKVECYKAYGKIEDDKDKLRTIIEILDGRPISQDTKEIWLKKRINELIDADASLFYEVVKDELLDSKVLIKKALQYGIISNRDGHFYSKETGLPLCSDGQVATLNNAAKFINQPRNQEYKFSIEAKINAASK